MYKKIWLLPYNLINLIAAKSFAVPLFMDVHKGAEFTLEDVKRNHLADMAVQSRYGVRYVQYWVNEEANMVFCLMEAPNKEACIKVHQEAHGDLACNVIQVEKAAYELFMGVTTIDEFELTHDLHGALDAGYRFFIAISFMGPEKVLIEPEFLTGKILREQEGREVNHGGQEIIGVFNSCKQAIECAKNTQIEIGRFLTEQQLSDRVEFRIALAAGEPVTEQSELFADTLDLVIKLNTLAGKNQIVLSSLVKDLSKDHKIPINKLFKVMKPSEEQLLIRLMEVAENKLSDVQFSALLLSNEMGMNTAQLTDKVTQLTKYSPTDFINELRLKKAEKLIRIKGLGISDIAAKVGFSDPSIFVQCFSDRFGISPAQYPEPA